MRRAAGNSLPSENETQPWTAKPEDVVGAALIAQSAEKVCQGVQAARRAMQDAVAETVAKKAQESAKSAAGETKKGQGACGEAKLPRPPALPNLARILADLPVEQKPLNPLAQLGAARRQAAAIALTRSKIDKCAVLINRLAALPQQSRLRQRLPEASAKLLVLLAEKTEQEQTYNKTTHSHPSPQKSAVDGDKSNKMPDLSAQPPAPASAAPGAIHNNVEHPNPVGQQLLPPKVPAAAVLASLPPAAGSAALACALPVSPQLPAAAVLGRPPPAAESVLPSGSNVVARVPSIPAGLDLKTVLAFVAAQLQSAARPNPVEHTLHNPEASSPASMQKAKPQLPAAPARFRHSAVSAAPAEPVMPVEPVMPAAPAIPAAPHPKKRRGKYSDGHVVTFAGRYRPTRPELSAFFDEAAAAFKKLDLVSFHERAFWQYVHKRKADGTTIEAAAQEFQHSILGSAGC